MGGIFSVALSLGLLTLPGVTRHHYLVEPGLSSEKKSATIQYPAYLQFCKFLTIWSINSKKYFNY
tara:strand:- start:435 stop:629 length:195 start_codon:yes stop_codon:yes gene_type:complete